MAKDRYDGLFGDGFTESTKVNKKDIEKFDKRVLKEQEEYEKRLKKEEKETEKAFLKSEKRRIKDLNKAIEKGNGLIEEDGYLFYRTKEKFTKDNREPSNFTTFTRKRPHGLINLIVNIIKWFKTKLIPAITSIFKKNTKPLDYENTNLPNDNIDVEKNNDKNVTKEEDIPTISEPIKLLYTAPINNDDRNIPELNIAPDDIVKEYLEFSKEQGVDGNDDKAGIVYFLAMKLTTGRPITDKNLMDMANFLTGYECEFDSKSKSFVFTMDAVDGKKAQVCISDNGEISIPDYIKDENAMIENALRDKPFENEKIETFATFLKENPNYIRAIVTENMISKTNLNIVKNFVEDYPQLKTMEESIDEFEAVNKNPEAYEMLNKTMARMSYIDNVYPETIFEYGFIQPSKIIPNLSNIKDYEIVLQATQNFVANEMKLADAYTLSDAFIIDANADKLATVITDKQKLNLIGSHIYELTNRGIHSPMITNLVKTYNACADERSMRIAIASINNQLESKKFINDIISEKQTLSYSDTEIATNISKALKENNIDNLKESFNNHENTLLNNCICALNFDELISISSHLSQEDRVLFNQVVSATKGEPEQEKPNTGDTVLGGNSFFITDGKQQSYNDNKDENEFFRTFGDGENSL